MGEMAEEQKNANKKKQDKMKDDLRQLAKDIEDLKKELTDKESKAETLYEQQRKQIEEDWKTQYTEFERNILAETELEMKSADEQRFRDKNFKTVFGSSDRNKIIETKQAFEEYRSRRAVLREE